MISSFFSLNTEKTMAQTTLSLNSFLVVPVALHLSEQNRNYNRSAEIIAFVGCDNSTNKMSEVLKASRVNKKVLELSRCQSRIFPQWVMHLNGFH